MKRDSCASSAFTWSNMQVNVWITRIPFQFLSWRTVRMEAFPNETSGRTFQVHCMHSNAHSALRICDPGCQWFWALRQRKTTTKQETGDCLGVKCCEAAEKGGLGAKVEQACNQGGSGQGAGPAKRAEGCLTCPRAYASHFLQTTQVHITCQQGN